MFGGAQHCDRSSAQDFDLGRWQGKVWITYNSAAYLQERTVASGTVAEHQRD